MESLTDHLTGLFNREDLGSLIRLEEDRCKIYGHPTTIIMIDLNNLKISDEYGHDEGDKLIEKTAQTIKDVLTQTNVSLI